MLSPYTHDKTESVRHPGPRSEGALGKAALAALVGTSPAMERLRTLISRAALSSRPALVTGPTGSGKDLVVRAIHALGPSPLAPLLDVNCGAIPDSLMESLLFGHEKGSFTSAFEARDGLLAQVGRGTFFLDEIAELPLHLQTKLLSVIESGRFRPIGRSAEQRFFGRLVTATHADLEARVREGRFREDLYYRLHVLTIAVPPLEERRSDISLLISHFCSRQSRPLEFTKPALAELEAADWPGHVRQLRNLIDRLAVFADNRLIDLATLKFFLPEPLPPTTELDHLARELLRLPISNKLEAMRDAAIAQAMTMANRNQTAAARLLGIHRKAIARRMIKPT